MRTKALLLSAALVAAGVATSMAQSNVYSLNIVGYVNVPVKANSFVLIANPLDDGAGDIVTNVLNLPGAFDNGTVQSSIYLFQNGQINPAETYFNGFGWYPGTNTIPPGTGLYFYSDITTNITFTGSVVTSNNVALQSGFSLVASSFSVSSDLWTLGLPQGAILSNPSANPDAVYRFDYADNSLDDISTYFPGYGWYEQVNNNPVGGTGGPTNGPTIGLGEGFFYQNNNASYTWTQSFTVQ